MRNWAAVRSNLVAYGSLATIVGWFIGQWLGTQLFAPVTICGWRRFGDVAPGAAAAVASQVYNYGTCMNAMGLTMWGLVGVVDPLWVGLLGAIVAVAIATYKHLTTPHP